MINAWTPTNLRAPSAARPITSAASVTARSPSSIGRGQKSATTTRTRATSTEKRTEEASDPRWQSCPLAAGSLAPHGPRREGSFSTADVLTCGGLVVIAVALVVTAYERMAGNVLAGLWQ